MLHVRLRLLPLLLIAGLFAGGSAVAQTPGVGTSVPRPAATATIPASSNGAAPVAAPAPRLEAKPEVFYLRDKAGLLQPVVGFSLEKFEEMLLNRDDAEGNRKKPDFRFDSVSAKGAADDRYARLDVKFVVYLDAAAWSYC